MLDLPETAAGVPGGSQTATGRAPLDAKDLLLADLARFEESLARNEEVGEKRFSFFLTLVAAVTAGLVSLATRQGGFDDQTFRAVFGAGMGALLVVGMLTYARMLQRNRVTDEHKQTLKYIRVTFVDLCPELAAAGYAVPRGYRGKTSRWLRGGYMETVGTMNGLLLFAILWVALQRSPLEAGGMALVLTLLLWLPAGLRHRA
jgi:hypothetical protein